MALEVVWARYGEEAHSALHGAIAAAKAGDPLRPVAVIVPSNHVGVASRRLLSSGRLGPVAGAGVGLCAVTFLTTYRLAELLGSAALAGTGRRPVSTPVLAAAVRAELAAAPGLFASVAEHPATEAALVGAYRELRDISPAALDSISHASRRAGEVVRIHRAARERLEPHWYDEEDLLTTAAGLADSHFAASLGAIVVHLPQRLSRHSLRLLVALGDHRSVAIVAGITGLPGPDAEVLDSLREMGTDLPGAGRLDYRAPVAPGRTTILTASDGDEEVRAAVRAVMDAVRAGTRLDRIAVLHAGAEPYARLAHEQLRAAGIPTNGAAVEPLAARVTGRTLIELLALPGAGFRRQDLLGLLSSAPVVHDGRRAPTTAWERLSREAAVVAGRDHWDTHLSRLAEQKIARAERAEVDDQEPDFVATREREEAHRALDLRELALSMIDDLTAAAATPRAWSEHAAWAKGWLELLLGAVGRRDGWPADERKAEERVHRSLDRLGALDAVEGAVDLEVFRRTLEIELDSDLGRVGRFGEGVLVGSVEMGVGLDLDLVVLLGLAEGLFPSIVRDDSLLPDNERAGGGAELGLRAQRVERQHRHLIAALSAANRQLLCIPRGDLRRSTERVASRWVEELREALAGAGPVAGQAPVERASVERQVASFEDGLRRMASPATRQEHRLRSMLAAGGALSGTEDLTTIRGAEVISARGSQRFTRFDGNLAGVRVPSPVDRPTSPTRLERWADCPHAHLVFDLLRAAPVENPEDELVMTPLDKGSLVHDILERFLAEVLERPRDDQPNPSKPWSEADRQRLAEIGADLCAAAERAGLTGRPLYWRRDRRRILADLRRFLHEDSEHRAAHGTRPVAVELGFGFDGGLDAVSLPLPDGRELRVRGRADRLDIAADGTLWVVDYKTGKADHYKDLAEHDPVLGGTRLQLPLYGLAGRAHHGTSDAPVRAEYWFVTSAGRFKRVGYPITPEVLGTATATIGAIVDGIEAGVFPARPEAMKSTNIFVRCKACDPDGLGTAELRRQWERKRNDPALVAYAEMVEPTDVASEVAAT